MKIAIVHPWYIAHGGAEQTVDVLGAMYPEADFFTLLFEEHALPNSLRGRRVTASSWNWIPWKYRLYRYALPFLPMAFEAMDLRGYDLIISSDSCVAKGIIIDQNATHICYCHSPMRCLWDLRWEFRANIPFLARPIFGMTTHYVRQWDFNAAQRVDEFVANSENVKQRIAKLYKRESTVIFPPVEIKSKFATSRSGERFYLSVGRLTYEKRLDILIEACNALGRKLVIVGEGREKKRLKKMAGPHVSFAGRVSQEELHRLYAECRAFLFAADEDFGIVPVEAQSYGKPVIALGRGGSLETVIDATDNCVSRSTGVYFPEQSAISLQQAIHRFEEIEPKFDPVFIRENAQKFSRGRFVNSFAKLVERSLSRNLAVSR